MQRRRSHFTRSARGFTLFELIVTVLIMGVAAAVAAPKYSNSLRHFKVDGAARRVVADLKYARQYARIKGTSQSVVFDAAADSYTLTGIPHPDHPSQTFVVDLTAISHPSSIESAGFGASGTEDTITFDMYGRPDFGGTVVVGRVDEFITITVNAVTGEVTMP